MNPVDIAGKITESSLIHSYSDNFHTMSRAVVPDRSYVASGMPPLDTSGKAVSFFEFWPTWVMYAPVALQWLLLSAYYRSFSLPLIANPNIPSAGMVGFSKSEFLAQATEESQESILQWVTAELTDEPVLQQVDALMQALAGKGLSLPIVGKPDMGCRGVGIKLINNRAELEDYVSYYPVGSTVKLQRLADWEPEAGIFYIRYPNEEHGRIISMALKYSPYVIGDGVSTLRELLAADVRAGQISHIYEERHKDRLDKVIPKDEPFRLVFAASHCRGAVFRDAREYVTDALTQRIDKVLLGFPEFYYGRVDIKFDNIERLMAGEGFSIIEVNGASSEALHIWDNKASLGEAWAALLNQYGTLFKIGAINRQNGHKPPGILSLWKAWRKEQNLSNHYPTTD